MKFQNYETTIEAARHGSKSATVSLFQKFEPLLLATARRNGSDYRYMDAYQEACLAFLKAIWEWQAELGVPFPAFARAKVRGDVRTAMRRNWRYEDRRILAKVRQDEEESVNELWDHTENELEYGGFYGAFDIESRLDIEALIQLAGLSEREMRYIEWLMAGRTLKEMATMAHVSVETVKTWRKRSLQKLRTRIKLLEWDD